MDEIKRAEEVVEVITEGVTEKNGTEMVEVANKVKDVIPTKHKIIAVVGTALACVGGYYLIKEKIVPGTKKLFKAFKKDGDIEAEITDETVSENSTMEEETKN